MVGLALFHGRLDLLRVLLLLALVANLELLVQILEDLVLNQRIAREVVHDAVFLRLCHLLPEHAHLGLARLLRPLGREAAEVGPHERNLGDVRLLAVLDALLAKLADQCQPVFCALNNVQHDAARSFMKIVAVAADRDDFVALLERLWLHEAHLVVAQHMLRSVDVDGCLPLGRLDDEAQRERRHRDFPQREARRGHPDGGAFEQDRPRLAELEEVALLVGDGDARPDVLRRQRRQRRDRGHLRLDLDHQV
mmetsp:Transcript_4571/g.13740  ORF Transcript_4571/g.13740 Transcript_4571/m.13740 type:complete len:251 (-) Transcript_4571:605-1357(-)